MLCYLAGMEPYYLKCIKDGPFQPKTAEGDAKPKSQWTADERRVVVQDQRLKSIIMSCLPDDIMESVISCVSAKETWTDLVHSFEGPSDTKEDRIMDLKLEYQTFRAKFTESLSQTYTRYKTLLNELANDGVNLFKHEINVGFVNNLPEKWLTFSQGLRNANHTQTLELADIYESTAISTAFFSNNVIQDFQENSDDEVDERSSEEYLRDLDMEYHERALLANSKRYFARDCFSKTSEPSYKSPVNNYSSVSEGFQPKFTPKLIQSSPNSSSQADPKFQKDYKANKGLVVETFDWDEEEVFDDEEVTQVKVLMALADDELTVAKSHARNGEWVDITIRKVNTLLSMDEDADWQNYLKDELIILKQAKLDAVTFQIQNTELTKLNHALQEQLKKEKKINEKWLTSSKKVSQCISEQIPHQKKKVLGGELFTESSSKMNENLFVPASMRILVPESQVVNESLKLIETSNTPESSKDFEVESVTPLPPLKNLQGASSSSEVMSLIFQPHSLGERPGLGIMKHTKTETQEYLDNSVSGTITVSETKPTIPSVPTEVKNTEQESKLNELTKLVQMLIDEKNTSSSKSLRPKPIQKPQLKCELCLYTNHSTDDCYRILYCMKCKREDHRTSDHEMYTASLKRSENYKALPYQYASPSKQILKAKAKPFPPCTHCGFNDHRPDDYRNYPECEIYRSYDHFTSGHNRVIHIRGGILAESSQSSESSIGVKCNTCGSTIHSTSDHNEFDYFKRGEKIQATKAREPTKKEPIWYLDNECSRSMIGVKSYLHKYVEQPCPKVVFGDNSSCITEGYGSINCGGIVFTKVAFVNGLKYNLISISQLCDAKYIVQFDDKQRAIFNANKEIVPIAPRRNDVYVLDMSSLNPNRACFFAKASEISPMSINHEKYTLVIVDEYSRERIPDINYFYVFGCPVFIHNHKDHLGKLDAKADDGYFLGYSSVSKAFRVYNTRRQQIEETYHVTFDESMEAIRFTNTSVDEIGIDDSSRYPPDEFLHEDDPSRQYQVDYDISYYVIPHGRSLTELTQENHVPEAIVPNEPDAPLTEDTEDPPDLINTEGIHEQNIQDKQITIQTLEVPSGSNTEEPSRNNTDILVPIVKTLVPDVFQSHVEGMLTRSMVAKLTTASANECLFAEFLFEIEPKKVSEALKHPGWINAMQEELNQSTETKMEAIKIFLAFATYMNFKVYQMDVKSVFLNGKPKEEVYVKQPHGFESSEFPNYVCKLDIALYGLKQAQRACSMCKISVKSKRITSNNCEKNSQVPERKSTSGACQILGGKFVCWSAKKQQSVAMSSAKAEYVAADGDHILKGDIELHFIPTEYQLADIFTIPLDEPTFTRLKAELGMLNID
ncbi:retrovirus-related pol polyprotein from transposon TNT 1-94 [Tanacetum coccineum]|uniref:Retrovirus-related pol polyprotein from transposon TNT 1-94 n=1 Tax=Tanacetum coccineum TaxID=301880 RepID=A0ABQ5CPW5_9ASTR